MYSSSSDSSSSLSFSLAQSHTTGFSSTNNPYSTFPGENKTRSFHSKDSISRQPNRPRTADSQNPFRRWEDALPDKRVTEKRSLSGKLKGSFGRRVGTADGSYRPAFVPRTSDVEGKVKSSEEYNAM
jgi:hypothetical protein